ncbi:hypothetical protein VSR01_00590 [Actinacidiphila sp. DG2A-62]|nr:hypothetical protein [Actinacidiphila sp. DG2A-62]MEC3992121.1 hypothetical protein [Actinacidiphila sp. DG2A-62]
MTKRCGTCSPAAAGGHVQRDIDAWFARALATGRSHCTDHAARQAAADLLPRPIPTHAALLVTLARLQPPRTSTRSWQLSGPLRRRPADPAWSCCAP